MNEGVYTVMDNEMAGNYPASINEATSVCLKKGTICSVIKCISTVALRYVIKHPIRIGHSSLFKSLEMLPLTSGNPPPSPST